MRRSLQRHLSLVLGGAIVLAGLLAAMASFVLAYQEAKEFQDDMLRQIAILSARNKENSGAQSTQQRENEKISDPDSRVTIYHLPHAPPWLKADLRPGLHTLSTGTEEMRVLVGGRQIVVVQLTEARNEVARNSALRTLIPLLFLLPILVWLIVRIVRLQLAPITQLSQSLDEQAADHPESINTDSLPDEITPFVHAINRLLARVNLLMGQQRRFIADAAHELRSPLTALSLQAENLSQAKSLGMVRERVLPLQDGIKRARQLTEQLLSLAKTQAGSKPEVVINLSIMARELISEYLPLAQAKHIDLGLDECATLTLYAEPEALRLIVKNALENALKYTPDGGEVTLRLLFNKSIVVEVVDNGPGIPVAERERVFDAFYRMSGTRGEGNGLGLAITQEAAKRLGGKLSLHDNSKGAGLVFRYQLETRVVQCEP